MFCNNCDIGPAQFKCMQCVSNECLFCSECKAVHCKIKAFKHHEFTQLPKQSIICTNCETSESKFICRECDDANKYLCVGCSVIHPKIKAFRNHHIMAMHSVSSDNVSITQQEPFRLSLDGISDVFVSSIEIACSNISTRSLTDPILWQTLLLCLAATVVYYKIVNVIFRKYAPLVNIAMAIWLYQWLQSDKFKVSAADKAKVDAKQKVSPSLSGLSQKLNNMGGIFGNAPNTRLSASWNEELNPDDFKGEFWYSTESKKASLRPRTRPYRGRRPGTNSNTEELISTGGQQILT